MLVSDALLLVRYAVGDMDDSKTSYYQKMVALNAANRFIRKLAFEYKPSLLNYTETQNTVASTVEYTLTHKPNKIRAVRVAGTKIDPINPDIIKDLTETGKPRGYYMSAFDKVSFWPVPDAVYSFSVYMVEGSAEIADSDTLLWTPDLADVMVAYTAGLLTNTLDADSLKMDAIRYLGGIEHDSSGVVGYWDAPAKESDW
jgi:hypothetical protein